MIRYRCPSCRNVDERPDGDAGRLVACASCGQKLKVPPAPKDVVVPAEPLPPRPRRRWSDWVWRPAPRNRRENSGETLIRVGVNVVVLWFLLHAGFWLAAGVAVGLFVGLDWLARLLAGH